MVGIIKSWACRESHCLIAILLTFLQNENHICLMDFGWQNLWDIACHSVRALDQSNDFCMHTPGCGERSYEGVLSTLFVQTESLTEPGGH